MALLYLSADGLKFLQNAASASALLLTTEAGIVQIKDPAADAAAAAAMAGGGGMGGMM